MPKLYISAGHHISDSGSVWGTLKENELTIKVRDFIKTKLGDSVLYPADNLTLRQTIDEINQSALPEKLGIEIHFNNNANINIRGVEVYYSKELGLAQQFAQILSR